MRRSAWLLALTAASSAGAYAQQAAAVPVLRRQVDQHGDILWIGNTSAQECAAGAGAPVPLTHVIGACGTQFNDSAPDIFWRADSPIDGQAAANNTITAANARSTAVLTLPVGATVTYARIYWGGQLGSNTPDTGITLDRVGGFSASVTADQSYSVAHPNTAGTWWYESTADVTSLVSTNASGGYRVSGIDSVGLVNFNSENPFVAWSIIVFYELASEPTRNLALFDGLDLVSNNNPVTVTLSGFLVPNAGFDAKLGVMAYEGDTTFTNDALIFNTNTLTDAVNPAANFFNGSRSWLGSPVSVAGDLPQMSGLGASMSGFDLDVVNITPYVAPAQTSATIQATSSGDTYMIGAFATSISTYRPDYGTSTKTFVDLNGGGIFRNDILEYTITAPNSGNDTALGVVLTDPLPTGITYIPGTLQISAGDNAGVKTDAAGDDQGEYNASTRTLTVRLGVGANATNGGTMAPGASASIKFQARVETDGPTIIANQATITASGQRGNPTTGYPSGNGSTPGTPTNTPVDECTVNGDCPLQKPLCYVTPNPNICVVCVSDSDCGATDSGRVCETPGSQMCIDGCRGTGGNGCPAGRTCTSTTAAIGICLLPDGGLPPLPDASLDVSIDGSDGAGGSGGTDASIDGTGGAAGSGPDARIDNASDDGGAGADGAAGTDGGGGRDGDGAAGSAGASGRDGGDGAAGRAGSAGAAGTDGGRDGAGGAAGGDDGSSTGSAGDAGDGGSAGDDTTGGTAGAAALPGGTIEGGGCACTTPGSPASGSTRTMLLLGLTALAATWRRRRRS
jgi:clumping factor A